MPRQLALSICFLFVLWLLRIDRKNAPGVSLITWIPTLWMLLIAGKPLGRWFGSSGDFESGSLLDRAFLSALLCIGLIILVRRRIEWSRVIKENIALTLLIGFMLISVLWSDIPYISFKRWTRELIAVVMGLLVLTERDPRRALESIFRRTIYVLIPFSYILIHYFPAFGREYHRWTGELMYVGVTLQKNGLGRLCIFAAFFIVWTFIRRWQGRDTSAVRYQTSSEIVVLIITLGLLKGPSIGAMSATAVVSFSVALAAFVGLLFMNKLKMHVGDKRLMAIIAVIIIFGTNMVFTAGSSIRSFTSSLGRDETLTGRTEIWASVLPNVIENPVVGSGFGSFWTPTNQALHEVREAHSGYLDVLLELGFVGLLLFFMFLLAFCRKAKRAMTQDFYWGSLFFCYVLMAAIHNISESSLNSFTNHLTAVLLFLSVSAPGKTKND